MALEVPVRRLTTDITGQTAVGCLVRAHEVRGVDGMVRHEGETKAGVISFVKPWE